MSAADRGPGPTNQKSVPGPRHSAAPRPPLLAWSASSPRAMAPVAWIITPPRSGEVGTAFVAAALACWGCPRDTAGAAPTFTSDSRPGWERTRSGASADVLPSGDSRLTATRPAPDDAAVSVSPEAVAPVEPGAGQARSAEDTPARAGAWLRAPAARADGGPVLARPKIAATATTTSTAPRYLFAKRRLTSRLLRNHVRAAATGRGRHRRQALTGGAAGPWGAAAGQAGCRARPSSRTAPPARTRPPAGLMSRAGSPQPAARFRTGFCARPPPARSPA